MSKKTTARRRKDATRKPKRGAEFSARREMITPKIAERYLELLLENQRHLRKRDVERYVEAMKAGRWKFTGEAIKFDTHGQLINGQHRLQAVILSGVSIKCEVQRNVPDDAFMELDTGVTRTPGDLLRIAGYRYTSNVAAIIRHLISIYEIEGGKFGPSSLAKRKCPPATLLEYAEQHGDALIEAAKATMSKDAKQVCSPPALFGALFFMFAEYNPKGAKEFFATLIEGVAFERGRQDPIYQLRRFLLDLKTSKHKRRPNYYKGAVIIKAWNAFQDRDTISSLRFSENETWPEINRRKLRVREDVAKARDKRRTKEQARRERAATKAKAKRKRTAKKTGTRKKAPTRRAA